MSDRHAEHPTVKPLLITGSPRSGTTWVGRMLAVSPIYNYIHEPFNPYIEPRRGICNAHFEHPFTYICEDNESEYYEPIKRMLEGRYDWRHELLGTRSLKGALNTLTNWRTFASHRNKGGVPLIKDPIALMSAEWLARRFDIHCIVMIRHPAAFVSSMKRLNWASHPEKWALSQKLLMRDYIGRFEGEIRVLQQGDHDVIERASLAWKIHHHVIHQYQEKHKDWVFLRHEDISQNPADSFEKLYRWLGIPFTGNVKQMIDEYSNAANPSHAVENEKTIKLNSRANISSWKYRLTPAEIDSIRERVEDVAQYFYADSEWSSDNAEGATYRSTTSS